MPEVPERLLLLGEDGMPRGVVDVAELQSKATILMYALAAAAGDHEAVERVCEQYLETVDPDICGFVAAAALSLSTHNVVAPLLDVIETAMPELNIRDKLRESHEHAVQTLGGGAA
ncbi:hypothetical protein [Nocardia sp. NPDC003726]